MLVIGYPLLVTALPVELIPRTDCAANRDRSNNLDTYVLDAPQGWTARQAFVN